MTATIGSALAWWASCQPERAAVIVGEGQVDYQTLEAWSSRAAQQLQAAGVHHGDRVGLLAPNDIAWTVAALAIIKAGAVIVPLNSRFRPAELRNVLDAAGATTLIAHDSLKGVVEESNALGAPVSLVTFSEIEVLRIGEPSSFRIDRDPDEPIAIIFTSGSTGLSKGVVLTNRTLLSIVFEASLTEKGFRQGSTSLLVLPLAFTPGLVWGLLMTTVLGGTIVVERELDPSRAVRLVEQHRVQALFGVPLIFQAIASAPEFADADLSSVETAIVGGAAVPVPLLEAWAAKDVALRQIYGMTEAGGVATATLREEFRDHPGSCGAGSIFTSLKVVRDDGTPAAPGEPGEILIQGPGVTPGYWNEPEITADVFRDGWLRSGDLGKVDEKGRITFVDRLKDLIITGGINVSPVELEAVIARIPGVAEVAVIAAPDEKFGETPAAIVTRGGALEEATVVEECAKVLSSFKVPSYVVLRDDPLPRLPNGKISKVDIRAEYADLVERFAKVR
ncbi:class I adenylate-forming enzyme family protein [Aeromicrobium ginsengisoli]|uniref:Long-chain fatty acid--CoA ligase n=1 Tax=Aeromicrobium ginsengisoli TaxID=363867 RepID=A0A5M4F8V4_9ACTN|nr:AMP-binding protein [Aeromicrobium ginsengisoli]KAA1394225.1 long-chain fatty acid--CoA ligase [Aeromicrobium ginsengisoli]